MDYKLKDISSCDHIQEFEVEISNEVVGIIYNTSFKPDVWHFMLNGVSSAIPRPEGFKTEKNAIAFMLQLKEANDKDL